MTTYKYSLKREASLTFTEPHRIADPKTAADYLRKLEMSNSEQEHFLTLTLDAKNKITGWYTVSIGLLDKTVVHAREVFRFAIIQGAAKIVIAHNHPSGDSTPSQQDINATKELVSASKIIGIEIVDHIIIGDGTSYYSLRENGLID